MNYKALNTSIDRIRDLVLEADINLYALKVNENVNAGRKVSKAALEMKKLSAELRREVLKEIRTITDARAKECERLGIKNKPGRKKNKKWL